MKKKFGPGRWGGYEWLWGVVRVSHNGDSETTGSG